MPYQSWYFFASASRRCFAPQVMAYWFTLSRIARIAASFKTSGQGKLGKPCARLMAPCSLASRVMPRMTDSVKPWVRAAVCIGTNLVGKVRRGKTSPLHEAVPRVGWTPQAIQRRVPELHGGHGGGRIELSRLFEASDARARDSAWADFVAAHSRLLLHVARSLTTDLAAADRLLLKLRFDDDLSAREIAGLVGLPTPFHVYRRLNALLGELRRVLRQRGIHGAEP